MASPSLTAPKTVTIATQWPLWLRPTLADVLATALLAWLILFTAAGGGLLSDSDTVYHIRVGEYVWQHRSVPSQDVFSFTRSGAPWFAWEWLSGLLFFGLYQATGFRGPVVLSAVLAAGSMALLLRLMMRRCGNAVIGVTLLHVAIAASSIHFLARPHMITLFLMTVSLSVIAEDRERPSRRLWLLIPLTTLWVNLHGGFLALLITTMALSVGFLLDGQRRQARRYALLAGGCGLASLVNPYGWLLYAHLWEYVRAGWIRELVQEFQAPRFDGAAGAYIEALIAIGLLAAGALAYRRRYTEVPPLFGWTHAVLNSVRHLPLLSLFALPPAAELCEEVWNGFASRASKASLLGTLDQLGKDHAEGLRRMSACVLLLPMALTLSPLGVPFPEDLPATKYPIAMLQRHAGRWPQARTFTRDSWATYLGFRYHPQAGLFVDGRSDFNGEALSKEYVTVLNGGEGWQNILSKYRVDTVLAPIGTGCAAALRQSPEWREIDADSDAVLLFRR